MLDIANNKIIEMRLKEVFFKLNVDKIEGENSALV